MERASKQYMKARTTVCHEQTNNLKKTIIKTKCELRNILPNNTLEDFSHFLTEQSFSVKKTINERHMKKLGNLQLEYSNSAVGIDKSKWVVNISSKPLTSAERQILEKGPKFATTPNSIPYKNNDAEIEFAIKNLPEESQDSIRTSTASILEKSRLPAHNTTLEERKALKELKNDKTQVITKADKGNRFVVMDRKEYDEKMNALLSDEKTYKKEKKQPFKKIERELNARLLTLKKQGKLNKQTYKKLHSTDGLPPAIQGSVKHHKLNNPLRHIVVIKLYPCKPTTKRHSTCSAIGVNLLHMECNFQQREANRAPQLFIRNH